MEKDDVVNIYTMEYYAIIKKNEIMPVAAIFFSSFNIRTPEF